MSKSRMLQLIEREQGQTLEEILRRGLEAGKTREQIAAELGVSRLTLRRWIQKLGAQVVTMQTLRFPADHPPPPFPGSLTATPCQRSTGTGDGWRARRAASEGEPEREEQPGGRQQPLRR